ncbi:MAG: hypothetical protein QG588_1616 [Candidatus Poribacteria bacterium]|nr:hypothetical protein [Candidatus Poribacteria bacterium]
MKNVYFIIFILLFGLRIISDLLTNPSNKKNPYTTQKKGKISLLVLIDCFVISGLAVGFFLFFAKTINLYYYLFGIFLWTFGFVGRLIAIRTIGKSYSQYIEVSPDNKLVTSGIYSIVGHPLYMFYILEMTAFLLIKFNYVSIGAMVLVIIASLYRIKEEDRLLSEKFKDQFYTYSKKTKRLIPFIY